MLNDILAFFKREKLYTFLFLAIVTAFGYVTFSGISEDSLGETLHAGHARTLEEFQQKEREFQEEIKNAPSTADYLEAHPRVAMVLNLLSVFILFSVLIGLALNLQWWMRPQWREQWLEPAAPSAVPWSFGMLFKVVLLFIAGSFLAGLPLSVVYRFYPGGISENALLLLHTTLTDFLCVFFILGIVRKAGGGWSDLGLGRVRSWAREFLSGFGGYMIVLPYFLLMLSVVLGLAHLFHYEPPAHPLVAVFLEEESRAPGVIYYSVFFAIVIGPILEEIFFRGFCYPVLKARWGRMLAMTLSSAFFAAIHANAFAFLPIFVLGMGLTYLYEKRGTLFAPMVLHVVHNAVFIGYFFLAKDVILNHSGS